MYSIFLVDDEYLELKTLHQYIDWKSMGFYVVGTAENGRDALAAIEKIRPDVVITDIRMPVMDGISLARTIHRKLPQTVIVFLSGYNEFEYAKSALKVEAAGYLLKPLDMEELTEMMEIVQRKCDDNLIYRETALSIASEYLEESYFNPDPAFWQQNLSIISRMLNGCFGLERENTCYFIGLLTIDEYICMMKNTRENGQLLDTLRDEIRAILKSNKLAWFCRSGQYYIISGNNIHQILFQQYSQSMFRNWITYSHTDTASELADFHDAFTLLLDMKTKDYVPPPHNHLIKDVISLLQTNYDKSLSIDDIASTVQLSPNYLSFLFKEYTGQTVLEYLTEVRLEKAEDMLKSTSYKIYEISHRVGYENPSYFCMLFQKRNKVTPNQFRRKAKDPFA